MPYPLCQHVMIGGMRCGSPALRGHGHCYYHHSLRRLLPNRFHNWESYNHETDRGIRMIPMPLLEDATSLQTAYMQIVHGVLSGQMDLPRSRVALSALRAAARNLPMVKLECAAVAEGAEDGCDALASDVEHSVETPLSGQSYRRLPDPPEEQKRAYEPPAADTESGPGYDGPASQPGDAETGELDPVPLYIQKRAAQARARQAAVQARTAAAEQTAPVTAPGDAPQAVGALGPPRKQPSRVRENKVEAREGKRRAFRRPATSA